MTNDKTPRPGRSGGQDSGEEVPHRVTAPGDINRARRRWWLDRQRNRRRVSLALDAHLTRMYDRGRPGKDANLHVKREDDYWRDSGMHLGVAQRDRAGGSA